ncbi:hypothetical protein SAMN04487950_1446 [Halogranum rubrum]|uniref:Uncharacterized protein n=1 Tax=Halogranum rubrum TaxID=553466 RepID=A0A1I4CW05_9EURY|nr:hypothetical protein SAMN04487950_1446 [Halogranum rubrum]
MAITFVGTGLGLLFSAMGLALSDGWSLVVGVVAACGVANGVTAAIVLRADKPAPQTPLVRRVQRFAAAVLAVVALGVVGLGAGVLYMAL